MSLRPQLASPEAFAPFGWVRDCLSLCLPLVPSLTRPCSLHQLVDASEDGTPFGPQDAVLELRNGTPRLYLMRLPPRPLHFSTFARHNKVTQCLAGLGTTPWYLAVAPPPAPGDGPQPEVPVDAVLLFEFRPPTAVCLRQGCWHSGPYFTDDGRDFYNLEMTDTNVVDYNSGRTRDRHTFRIDLGKA